MSKYTLWLLALALLAGGVLRLWGLGTSELTFDEGLYAFRSVGYLDYLESSAQPTPIQWLAGEPTLPSWLTLSFHDHPPLVFLIQHAFFRAFGDSLLVARLPSVLAGIASIALLFLIARGLARGFDSFRNSGGVLPSEAAGFVAAALGSVGFAYVGISRLAMLESLLVFMLLLNIYFFLRFLDDARWWPALGLTAGLAMLTKYVSVFLAPVYAALLLAVRPMLLSGWRLSAAIAVAAAVFSPVIIYNALFYTNFGHFDLQFSYLLGQETPQWQGASGKTQEPFSNLSENLAAMYSLPFLVAALAGMAVVLRFGDRRTRVFLLGLIISITLLLLLVGSAIRFSALYAIPATLTLAVAVALVWQGVSRPRWLFVLLAAFLVFEATFTVNRVVVSPPDYGVVKLDRYFNSLFGHGRGPGLPHHPNPHLDRVIQTHALARQITLPPTGLVYDDNLGLSARLWVFARRQYYHGMPIISASAFGEALHGGRAEMFKGFTLYFAKAGPGAPLRPVRPTGDAEAIERSLLAEGRKPEVVIAGDGGQPAFAVYKFSLP